MLVLLWSRNLDSEETPQPCLKPWEPLNLLPKAIKPLFSLDGALVRRTRVKIRRAIVIIRPQSFIIRCQCFGNTIVIDPGVVVLAQNLLEITPINKNRATWPAVHLIKEIAADGNPPAAIGIVSNPEAPRDSRDILS